MIKYIIRTNRGFVSRVSILNDRDKRVYPFILVIDSSSISEALKFTDIDTAQTVADLLLDTKEGLYTVESAYC